LWCRLYVDTANDSDIDGDTDNVIMISDENTAHGVVMIIEDSQR